MSLRTNADFILGVKYVRVIPLNADLSIPLPVSANKHGRGFLIGGTGPFDFSAADSSGAVVIYHKADNGTKETKYVDLSAAADISAVTIGELVTALTNAAITGATFTATVAPDPKVGYLKCIFATGKYHQLYGQCAEVAGFGQGKGVKYAVMDTAKSIGDTPVNKDSQSFTTVDANNLETQVNTDGYRMGVGAKLVDTANDKWLRSIVEGGTIDDDGIYSVPTSETTKVYFMVEVFYKVFRKGINKEGAMVGYELQSLLSCKGSMADRSHEAGFSDATYDIKGDSYTDENGVLNADTIIEPLTIAEFLTLDVGNTSAY
jgi:hypothetical protein